MAVLAVNPNRCNLCGDCLKACPFGAIEIKQQKIEINVACKMCRNCIKACTQKAVMLIDNKREAVNKDEWKGILVFVEYIEGKVHPVTLELVGKARELAAKTGFPVYGIFIGSHIFEEANHLLIYGLDKIFVYDDERLKYYKADLYANVFEDCIKTVKPSIVLIGATLIGRSLAPRLSVRFRTGLTADCTSLEVRTNTDLVQIRPAFGGNIMAQIVTPNTRPQFSTVRYKVMNRAETIENPVGIIERCFLDEKKIKTKINVIDVSKKDYESSISDAEILVVAGRGLKAKNDLNMIEELAELLGGQTAATRSLVEDGWMPYTKQIGLSGRTVRPKLIITCGVSGAVQFAAGMKASEHIMAINRDSKADIFNIAHYGIVSDIYEIIPNLISMIRERRQVL